MALEDAVAIDDGPSFFHRSERGELRIWLPAPTVMVFKYKGHTDVGHIEFIERTFDETFGPDQNHLHLFVDSEDQTGYDAEFRKRTSAWSSRVEPRTDTYCVFVKSRLVAIGVAITVLAVGGRVSVVSNRNVFRSRLEASVRQSLARAKTSNP